MWEPGQLVAGRYRLDERIGRGGMGEVWLGEDTVLARRVATKILSSRLSGDAAAVRRFQREARTLATIDHPGIVRVFDYGRTPDDTNYLIMDFVPGRSLDQMIREDGALPAGLVMEYVAQAAETLHAVHEAGIVHRDVKPANVMIRPDGAAVLVDFGIARGDTDTGFTGDGQVMSTAAYCAPEVASGTEPGPQSDLYSLGVTAYECLSGHRPFYGTAIEVAAKHLRDDPPPLAVPKPIRDFVFQALAKEPGKRWTTGRAMAADALAAAAAPTTEPSAFAGPVRPLRQLSWRPSGQLPWRSFAAVVLACLVAFTMLRGRPDDSPKNPRSVPYAAPAESGPSKGRPVGKPKAKLEPSGLLRATPVSDASSTGPPSGKPTPRATARPSEPQPTPLSQPSSPAPPSQPAPEEPPATGEPSQDQTGVVPDVLGLNEEDARKRLKEAGFGANFACQPGPDTDTVAIQDPPGGTKWDVGGQVVLWINRATC